MRWTRTRTWTQAGTDMYTGTDTDERFRFASFRFEVKKI
jgi:hypothetical protein